MGGVGVSLLIGYLGYFNIAIFRIRVNGWVVFQDGRYGGIGIIFFMGRSLLVRAVNLPILQGHAFFTPILCLVRLISIILSRRLSRIYNFPAY